MSLDQSLDFPTPTEYGSSPSSDSTQSFSTTVELPSPATQTVPASSSPMMLDSTSPTLTAFERWAARASDSQFNALAGAIGGFTSGVVTCPLDVIKTKLQAQGGLSAQKGLPRKYNGLVGTATVIWREEGLRGMYRGLGPIILGYLPTWAVWFTIYNKSKTVISQYQSMWPIHLCGAGAVLDISVPPSASHCEFSSNSWALLITYS